MLRFLAAMLVVLAHATGMVGERILQLKGEHFWRPGMSGVDLFFVISGFVMTVSSNKLIIHSDGWKIFVKRRLIRIVPLYWCATTLKILLVIALPSMALNTPIELWHTIASYFFVPTFDQMGNFIFPVVKVGWTLSYEIFFYIFFALAIFLRISAFSVILTSFSICTILNILATPATPFAYGFLNPILFEFVMGIAAAKFCDSERALNIRLGIVTIAIAIAIMFSTGDLPIWWRWVYWGLPSMAIVTVIAKFESQSSFVTPKIIARLGDSSYSLYLFHTFLVPLIGIILIKFNLLDPYIAVAACLLICPLACYGMYRIFELPFINFLKLKIPTN